MVILSLDNGLPIVVVAFSMVAYLANFPQLKVNVSDETLH
jgi:hypothetical protein